MLENGLYFVIGSLLAASMLYPISSILWRRARKSVEREYHARLPVGGLDIQAMVDIAKTPYIMKEVENRELRTRDQHNMHAMKIELAQSKIDNAEAHHSAAQLKSKLSERHRTIAQLQQDIDAAHSKLSTKDTMIKSLTAEHRRLKKTLARSYEDISALRLSLRQAHKRRVDAELASIQKSSSETHKPTRVANQNIANSTSRSKHASDKMAELYHSINQTRAELQSAKFREAETYQSLRAELKTLAAQIRNTAAVAQTHKTTATHTQSNVVNAADMFRKRRSENTFVPNQTANKNSKSDHSEEF